MPKKQKTKSKIKKVELTVDCSETQEKADENFLNILGNQPQSHKPFNICNIDGAYTNPGLSGRFWRD